jgi:hypothetical protein
MSCVFFQKLCVIFCLFVVFLSVLDDVLLFTVFMFYLDAGLLASSQYLESPATGHLDTGFSWFPLCLKANAEMVPKIPSCHYMLLMWPSRSKLSSNCIHVN